MSNELIKALGSYVRVHRTANGDTLYMAAVDLNDVALFTSTNPGYMQFGALTATGGDSVAVGVNPNTGASKYKVRNLSGTPQVVKNAPGTLYTMAINNFQVSTTAYVQVFDAATVGAVTLGTMEPDFEYPIVAGAGLVLTHGASGTGMANGIIVASTTADKGSSGSASGVVVYVTYA